MRYFFLNQSIEKKIIGNYPQATWMDSGEEFVFLNLKMEHVWECGNDWDQLFQDQVLKLSIFQSTKFTSILNCESMIRGIIILSDCLDKIKKPPLPHDCIVWLGEKLKIL